MAFCPTCGTQVADGAICSKCAGSAVQSPSPAAPAAAGLTDNVAGALAYVTIIPAIIFLVLEPFNKKRFIRFHAFQCIFFAIAWAVLSGSYWHSSATSHSLGGQQSFCGRWSVWPGL